ncbi:MAG: protein kinase [Enhygromyxa sp.]
MGETAKLHMDLEALIGSTIHDRYEVEALLGSGGMGAVFKARHTGLQRGVAVKVLHPEIGRDPAVSKRFDREAHSASRLDHPNCVRVTDFGSTEGGTKYLVMELLEGGDLDGRLGQPWAPDRAVALIEQVLLGLEHAHHVGVVHRDLKPENIFVTKDFRGEEVVKIVDFGIAKLIDEQGAEKLTRQGIVFGTPRYMSPEQAAGGKIDERSDLYALGLILYELLAGHPPFVSDDAAQLLRMHIMAPPPPLPASVPEPLAKIVEKLLEKSKGDRFASAREVLDALAQSKDSLAVASVVAAAPSGAPASSGVAWQPAPEPALVVRGGTLVGATGELAAASMSAARTITPTGSHAGVGQPTIATGPVASLTSGSQAITSEASLPSMVVSQNVTTTQPVSRPVLPIALAGVVLLLVLAGVGALILASPEQPPAAGEQTEPAQPSPAAAAAERQPADSERESSLPARDSKTAAAEPLHEPSPASASRPSSRPVRPSATPDAKPEKSQAQPSELVPSNTPTTPSEQPGGPTDPSDSAGGGVDPGDDPGEAPRQREATAEQQKQEPDEREPKGGKPDADRDKRRGKPKDQDKGKGKKKDD